MAELGGSAVRLIDRDGDPLDDIAMLQVENKISIVMQEGRIVKNIDQ